MQKSRVCCSIVLSLMVYICQAQVFSIEHTSDTTAVLVLTTDSSRNEWQIDYPTYQFQQGDINGDGKQEAFVGVIKSTRFDSTTRKRLFIFKNFRNLIRPMWMGSSLGHEIVDFIYADGSIWAAVRNENGNYAVGEYVWDKFGLSLHRWIEHDITEERARTLLNK